MADLYTDNAADLDAVNGALGQPAVLKVDSSTTVAAVNAWMAASLGRRRAIIGSMLIDAPIILQPESTYDFSRAIFTAEAGWTESNLFQNRAVAAVSTVAGVAMTAGSNVVTGTGFTIDLDGKVVSVPNTGISAFSGRAPSYGIFRYESATQGHLDPIVSAVSTSAVNAIASASGQTMSVFQRDTNIEIIGGVIDRRPAPNAGGDGNNKHVTLLRRIDGLKISGVTVYTDNAKYAWSIGDVSHADVSRLSFPETSSDGLHFIGPAYDVRVSSIRGATHDDLVSFTASDFSLYSDTSGDILNVRVTDITSELAVTAFKLIGGTGISVRDFVVDGIHGITTTRCVAIADDYTGATDARLIMRNLTVRTTNATAAQVELSATLARSIEIDGIDFYPVTTEGSTYGAYPRIKVLGAIEALTVRRARVPAPPANGLNWSAIGVFVSGGTVGRVLMDDWRFIGTLTGNGGLPIFYHTTLSDLQISNSKIENVISLVQGDAVTPLRLTTTNVVVLNTGHSVEIQGSITWLYSATLLDHFGSYLRSRGGATRSALLIGSGLTGARTPTNSQISLAGSTVAPTIRVIDPSFPVDLSILAKNNGDRAFNTNAALACGLGAALSDGANWKNSYTGTTY